MKKVLLSVLPFLIGFLLLGVLISGIGGGGGSYPVPPPATEEEAYVYQYTAYRLNINWEIPFTIHLMMADREQKSDFSEYNPLFDSLNSCQLKEEIWSEHEETDDEGNVTGWYWTLDETNYYNGAEEILSYLGLTREEKSIDTFMNTIDAKNSKEYKLELETEPDPTVTLSTYYDFSEEETEHILLLLEEKYFSQLYGNTFGGGDLFLGDFEAGTIAPNGMAIPLYYQYSGGWQNIAFGGGNIASSGCSVTCIGMVFTYLLGETITPDQIVAWTGNRYYVHPEGQGWGIFPACAGQWGVRCQNLGKDANAVVNALSSGKPVIASMSKGTFTKGGHFIVLRGVTADGKILVNDPNDNASKNHVNREFDLNLIMRESKNFWSFSK